MSWIVTVDAPPRAPYPEGRTLGGAGGSKPRAPCRRSICRIPEGDAFEKFFQTDPRDRGGAPITRLLESTPSRRFERQREDRRARDVSEIRNIGVLKVPVQCGRAVGSSEGERHDAPEAVLDDTGSDEEENTEDDEGKQ